MCEALGRTIALVREHMRTPVDLADDTELAAVLCEVDRICSLPFWLEEMTGTIPTDAELLNWNTIGDVARWVARVERRAA